MKTHNIISFLFLAFTLVCGPLEPLNAQNYNAIGAEYYITRSPSVTQQSIDSDIRLRSMGRLSLPVNDESN